MKFYLFKHRVREALQQSREHAQRLVACGPSKCLRLAVSVASGLLAVVSAVALVLVALVILVPVAVVVVFAMGLALAAWPFSVPSKA